MRYDELLPNVQLFMGSKSYGCGTINSQELQTDTEIGFLQTTSNKHYYLDVVALVWVSLLKVFLGRGGFVNVTDGAVFSPVGAVRTVPSVVAVDPR